jgi:radical SAM/Cys-rich protein
MADEVLRLLHDDPAIETLDLTGGAPELNASFRYLVEEAARLGRQVIERSNLTVLSVRGQEDLPQFLAERKVQVVASLPCYTAANVDSQRGRGTFEGSICGLRRLNAVGYGLPGSGLILNLVYNPLGAFLPGPQEKLEQDYRRQLGQQYGVQFSSLLTITNMPLGRFAEDLNRSGQREKYERLLADHFNEATVPRLMCLDIVSMSWDGFLYDCDFNQVLGLPVRRAGTPVHVSKLESLRELEGGRVATGKHCFGCTAGSGSSCRGALA